MNTPKLLLLIFTLLYQLTLSAQLKRIAVIGSSTSTGYGLPGYISGNTSSAPDSWVNKLKRYYIETGKIDTIYNISQSSTDCYTGMPTGYIPPPGRNAPNPNLNITKALSFFPKPDVIIVNYPTNSYDWLSIAEIMNCFRTIKRTANDQGVTCFITTTQPRNSFSPAERQKLRTLKDSIINQFGIYSIDFWTDIVQLPDLSIKPEYCLGDDVHLNVAGHTVLYTKVLERGIFSVDVPLPIRFKYVKPTRINANTIKVEFEMAEITGNEKFFLNVTMEGKKKRIPMEIPENIVANKKYTVTVKID